MLPSAYLKAMIGKIILKNQKKSPFLNKYCTEKNIDSI